MLRFRSAKAADWTRVAFCRAYSIAGPSLSWATSSVPSAKAPESLRMFCDSLSQQQLPPQTPIRFVFDASTGYSVDDSSRLFAVLATSTALQRLAHPVLIEMTVSDWDSAELLVHYLESRRSDAAAATGQGKVCHKVSLTFDWSGEHVVGRSIDPEELGEEHNDRTARGAAGRTHAIATRVFRALGEFGRDCGLIGISLRVVGNTDTSAFEFTSEVVEAMADMLILASESQKLELISIPFVPINSAPTEEAIEKLAAGLAAVAPTLRYLDVSGLPRLVGSRMFLDTAMPQLSVLENLYVGQCNIGDAKISRFSTGMRKSVGGWAFLEEVDFSQNQLSPSNGLPALFAAFRNGAEEEMRDVRIRVLTMNSCGIDDNALFSMCRCLAQCTSLTELNLRHNRITQAGSVHLADVLRLTGELRSLNLRMNPRLRDEGVATIASSFRSLPSLETLDVSQCGVSGMKLGKFAIQLKALDSLRILRMSRNDLTMRHVNWEKERMKLAIKCSDPADVSILGERGRSNEGKMATSFEIERMDRESGRVRYKGDITPDGESLSSHSVDDMDDNFGHPLDRLCAVLTSNVVSLREIDFSDCNLSEGELSRIAGGLRAQRHLEKLVLSGNGATGSVMCSLLAHDDGGIHETVKELNLCGCLQLGDIGLAELCEKSSSGGDAPLARCRALESLNISFCSVGPDGWDAFLLDLCQVDENRSCSPLQSLRELQAEGNASRDGLSSGVSRMTVQQATSLLAFAEKQLPQIQMINLRGSISGDIDAIVAADCARALSARGCRVVV